MCVCVCVENRIKSYSSQTQQKIRTFSAYFPFSRCEPLSHSHLLIFELIFLVGGQITQTVKYADDLVLMAKEKTVLQGMIDKLIETGRYYGMEMNEEKN